MWPLLLLSLVSVAISIQQLIFWVRTNGGRRRRWMESVAARLRERDQTGARALCAKDSSVYARVVDRLAGAEVYDAEATAVEIVEWLRPTIERGAVILSTIITAAPLMGILGTVTGIIQSFNLLGALDTGAVTDPSVVAGGISEALITTAFGLIVAVVSLFPYAYLRASSNRCYSSIDALVAAAQLGLRSAGPKLAKEKEDAKAAAAKLKAESTG